MAKYLLISLFGLLFIAGYSQNDTELKKRAKEFFAYNRYEDALKTLQSSRSLSRSDEEGRFLIALCLYHLNRLDEATDILNTLVAKENTPYPECWFYLGKIYQARNQFAEAGRYYKTYLKNLSANDPKRRMVVDIIRRCANGKQYQFKPAEAYVENIGNQVNTSYDEFAPVLSPNHDDRLYFSSAREGSMGGKRNPRGVPDERLGQYFSDIYFCNNVKGIWGGVQAMPYQLNSPQNETLLDFNKDGTALFYLKGMDLEKGDMLVDTFRQMENRVLSSDPFISPIDSRQGDCCPFFYNDTLVLFASRRPGGYGGFDLYKISKYKNRWTTPENLGSDINSAYDETTPFLARDGKTLYFSSNNSERSIGGLDIFRSVYIPSLERWSDPQNMGLPINSAADDEHFRLARDGFTAFFDSSRKDGYGQRDLYIAYFNNYLDEMEAPPVATNVTPKPYKEELVEPIVSPPTPNPPVDLPEAETLPTSLYFNQQADLDNAKNTAILRKISAQLLADPDQKLVITVYALGSNAGATDLSQAISSAERAAALLTRQGISENALFMRGAIAEENSKAQSQPFAMLFELSGDESFDAKGADPTYDSMLEQDLVYKVQIASSKSGNYNGNLFLNYPHPMVEKTLDFEYYRYTVGAFSTCAEAEALQKEIRANGIPGAFIAAYVHGRRIDRQEAKRYLTLFPDLQDFLK